MQQPELWIGLVEFKPFSREAYRAAGAFTNIVSWACDVKEFQKKAEIIAATTEMYVVEVEEAEPLAERAKRSPLTEEIDDMVLRAESNPGAIVHGSFHRYLFEEA